MPIFLIWGQCVEGDIENMTEAWHHADDSIVSLSRDMSPNSITCGSVKENIFIKQEQFEQMLFYKSHDLEAYLGL